MLSKRYESTEVNRRISAFNAYFAFGLFVYCLVRTEGPYRTKTVFILIAL